MNVLSLSLNLVFSITTCWSQFIYESQLNDLVFNCLSSAQSLFQSNAWLCNRKNRWSIWWPTTRTSLECLTTALTDHSLKLIWSSKKTTSMVPNIMLFMPIRVTSSKSTAFPEIICRLFTGTHSLNQWTVVSWGEWQESIRSLNINLLDPSISTKFRFDSKPMPTLSSESINLFVRTRKKSTVWSALIRYGWVVLSRSAFHPVLTDCCQWTRCQAIVYMDTDIRATWWSCSEAITSGITTSVSIRNLFIAKVT